MCGAGLNRSSNGSRITSNAGRLARALSGTRTLLKIFACAGLLICATGCQTRTVILDRNSDVVRIGPKMRGKVYVWQNGAWTLTGKVTLPEGWYAGPGPK